MAETKTTYYLAVDIGASSGRHILGSIVDGKIQLEEIHRFGNGMDEVDGHKCWDVKRLFSEIKIGLKKCKELGKLPVSMAIDTWAVDYVLLDGDGNIVGKTYGYRDDRTQGMDAVVDGVIPLQELYERTGIQKQIFNTIYQLTALKEQEPEVLEQAQDLLLIPDYLNYCLTGVKMTEYTNATTTQLVSPETKDWDTELIEKLGIKRSLFGEISLAGTTVGVLTDELEKEVGFNLTVIQAPSHDTASAVAAVPAKEKDFLYISSGTWSLMGVERMEADCSKESQLANFTNEGGYEYRYRFLKNIMGLWMIQSVRHEYNDKYSFAQLCDMAEASSISSFVNVNDDRFLAPEHMIGMIQKVCEENGDQVPKEPGEVARVIYRSLAKSYGETVKEIEAITGKTYPAIHIVGGGANADYLNQLTADSTGKTIYSGPTEGTAIGNLLAQMIKDAQYKDLTQARAAVFDSFEIKCFKPQA